MRELRYTVILEPDPEGGYVVFVPSLPGCWTQGDTFEEAIKNAHEAILGYIEGLRKAGEEAPKEDKIVVYQISVSAK